MKSRIVLILQFVCCIFYISTAQTTPPDQVIINDFNNFQVHSPNELLYIQTNKNTYFLNEDIYYHVFLTYEKNYKPSRKSNILYLELINRESKSVYKKIIQVDVENRSGILKLDKTLASGEYLLVAYTNWMKNFNQYYSKKILIVNAQDIKSNVKGLRFSTANNSRVEIFPEGGSIVTGTNNRIAVKISNKQDQGNSKQISLLDANNNALNVVKLDENGLGELNLMVTDSSSYHLKFENKEVFKLDQLLKEKKGQVTINSNFNAASLLVKVKSSLPNNQVNYTLIIESRGNLISSEQISKVNQVISLPIEKLDYGVNNLILLSGGKIVSERLVFRDHKSNKEVIKLSPKEGSIDVNINGSAEIENQNCLIVQEDSLNVLEDDSDFESFFLLESRIDNKIKNVGKLLYAKNYSGIDRILLACKSSSYYWRSKERDESPLIKYRAENKGFVIRGKLYSLKTKQSIADEIVILSIPGDKTQLKYAKTDKEGYFEINLENEKNFADVVVQPLSKNNDFRISLESSFKEFDTHLEAYEFSLNKEQVNKLNELYLDYQVSKLGNGNDSINNSNVEPVKSFFGEPHKSVEITKFIDLPSMEDIFVDLVKWVKIKKVKKEKVFKVFDHRNAKWLYGVPAVFVDGVFIHNTEEILSMDPKQIKRVDIVNWVHFYGRLKFNGTICIYTKKQNCTDVPLPDNTVRRILIAPSDHFEIANEIKVDNRKPEFKNTVFWNRIENDNIKIGIPKYLNKTNVKFIGISDSGEIISVSKSISPRPNFN